MPSTTWADAGWTRTLTEQVEEALAALGWINPPTWPGGFVVAGRPFTTDELADRLLEGGASAARDRGYTLLTDEAADAHTIWVALNLCMACPDEYATTSVTRTVAVLGAITVLVCDACAQGYRDLGYDTDSQS